MQSRDAGHAWLGTLRIFLAELLILPSGALTVAFLTRTLGPPDFGVFVITATFVVWIEITIAVLFGKATIKWIAEASDWRPAGAMTTRLHLISGILAGGAVFVLAGPISILLRTPEMKLPLQIFSLDIPLVALAQAHRQILVGLGAFSERALVGAARWTSRAVFIVVLVSAGFSINGAVAGSICSTLVELLVARYFVRPRLFAMGLGKWPEFWSYMIPLTVFSMSMRLFDKLDLVLLKSLGASTTVAGFYGAAQNLAVLPAVFTGAFAPLLLSTLSRWLAEKRQSEAENLMRDSWRMVMLLLPFACIVAGSGTEIAVLFFGPPFFPAGAVVSLLIFAAIADTALAVNAAIFTAFGKPAWTIFCVGPILILAVASYFLFVPSGGSDAAATITVLAMMLSALVTGVAVCRFWNLRFPLATLVRASVLSALVWMCARYWATPGWMVVGKDALLALLVCGSYVITREITPAELKSFARMFVTRSIPKTAK